PWLFALIIAKFFVLIKGTNFCNIIWSSGKQKIQASRSHYRRQFLMRFGGTVDQSYPRPTGRLYVSRMCFATYYSDRTGDKCTCNTVTCFATDPKWAGESCRRSRGMALAE